MKLPLHITKKEVSIESDKNWGIKIGKFMLVLFVVRELTVKESAKQQLQDKEDK